MQIVVLSHWSKDSHVCWVLDLMCWIKSADESYLPWCTSGLFSEYSMLKYQTVASFDQIWGFMNGNIVLCAATCHSGAYVASLALVSASFSPVFIFCFTWMVQLLLVLFIFCCQKHFIFCWVLTSCKLLLFFCILLATWSNAFGCPEMLDRL